MPTILQTIRAELEAYKRQIVLVYNGLYAAVAHTHQSTDIADFTEAAQDAVGALASAGQGLSYTDASPASLSVIGGVVLTADPSSPPNDTWWVVRETASPTTILSLRARVNGVTQTIAQMENP